ncbi:MAG: hypothetical protein AAF225_14640 [Pseudomonadota bacterium]
MVDTSDIVDQESLKKWLNAQSGSQAPALACRAALRVLPIFLEWWFTRSKTKDDPSFFDILRILLSSLVVLRADDDDAKRAAYVPNLNGFVSTRDDEGYAAEAAGATTMAVMAVVPNAEKAWVDKCAAEAVFGAALSLSFKRNFQASCFSILGNDQRRLSSESL